jgi:hypothetical protein
MRSTDAASTGTLPAASVQQLDVAKNSRAVDNGALPTIIFHGTLTY